MILRRGQHNLLHDHWMARKIHRHLTETHPEALADLPGEAVRRRELAAVRRARWFGLTWEINIADFVTLTFTVGPRFYEQPGIQRALRQITADDDPDVKFLQLGSLVTRSDWEEARNAAEEPGD